MLHRALAHKTLALNLQLQIPRLKHSLILNSCVLHVLQDVAALLDRGVYDNEVFAAEGWVDGLKYEDEIIDDLKKRTGGKVTTRNTHSGHVLRCLRSRGMVCLLQ